MKRNAIAIACAAVLAFALLLPVGLQGAFAPEGAIQEDVLAEPGDVLAGQAETIAEGDDGLAEVAESSQQEQLVEGEYVSGVVLVGLADDMPLDEVNARLQSLDYVSAGAITQSDLLYGYAELTLAEGVAVDDAMRQLEGEDFVAAAQPNYVYHLLETDETLSQNDDAGSTAAAEAQQASAVSSGLVAQSIDLSAQASVNDPGRSKQWGLDAIKAPEAWDLWTTNHAVTVAVLDSGIDMDHPDFADASNQTNIVGSYSVLQANKGGDTGNVDDGQGHGTHVAGIIAAGTNNGKGVAGASYNANIMPVQVIQNDSQGTVTSADAAAGMNYIVNNAAKYNVRVINISFGSSASVTSLGVNDRLFIQALTSAHNADILVVCAAGNGASSNSNSAYKCFPCDWDADAIGVINVQRGNSTYTRNSSSNFNLQGETTKDVSAPGTDIYSTTNNGAYGYKTGTSMATPFVSAAAALMFAADNTLTSQQAKDILCSTAQDLGDTGFDLVTGYGLIDADAAVSSVKEGTRISGARTALVGGTAQMEVMNGSGSWSWSSSKPSVAGVDASGAVKAYSAGSTIIKATNGSMTLSHTFTVYSASMKGYGRLGVGSTCTYTINSTAPGSWTWESSNPSVLSINASTGVAEAKKVGTATLTATSKTNANWVVRSVGIQVANISVSGASTVAVGNTAQLSLSGYSSVAWSSSNAGVATVTSKGVVRGVSPGQATITATSFVTLANSVTTNKLITVTAPMSSCTVSLGATSMAYTGANRTPSVTVKYGSKTLTQGTDYTVAYANNRAVGTATATVTGKGYYTGSVTRTFAITGQISSVSVSPTSFVYDGKAKTPSVSVVGSDGRTLAQGTDYTVAYSNNVNAGTATALVTGKGNYTGAKSKTFGIVKGTLETYAGADRYATAQKISSAAAAATSSVKGIIVCSCNEDRFPDALSAAGLSGVLGYPVVTVNGDGLTSSDRAALSAMRAKCSAGSLDILVVGGAPSVSFSVESALKSYGRVSKRFGGADRYETNRMILEYGRSCGSGWSSFCVFLSRGDNFPDALTIAPYLVKEGCPIVLVSPSATSLTAAQRLAVGRASRVIALGSQASVTDALLRSAGSAFGASTSRLAGPDRYATSAAIVKWELGQGMFLEGAGVATGEKFPDSLSSSWLLGSRGSVLGLVSPSGSNADMMSVLKSAASAGAPSVLRVFGSTASVPASVYSQLASAVGWPSYSVFAK